MNINPSWTYKDIIKNLRTLRLQYEELITSFLYLHDQINFIRETRDTIYALPIEEFEKDRVWEYMNGDISPIDAFILFRILN